MSNLKRLDRSMTDLSILCVTKLGRHAEPFLRDMERLAVDLDAEFVLGLDGADPERLSPPRRFTSAARQVCVQSAGYIESVLDSMVAECSGEYVLRLDDDEAVSMRMGAWLADRKYRESDHWAFPRMHMWPDEQHYITNPPLWKDLQTRLSVKAKAGGRLKIHDGSPYGTGTVADVAIEHHKFLVRDRDEREKLLEGYKRLLPGAGAWAAFSVPEQFAAQLQTRPVR